MSERWLPDPSVAEDGDTSPRCAWGGTPRSLFCNIAGLALAGMTFRIAQISDTHLSDDKPFFVDNFVRIGEALRADRPDLVLNSGDIALDGASSESDLAAARALHDGLDLPMRFLPGNHDLGDCQDAPSHGESAIDAERRARYVAHFGSDWWTLDVPGWRLLGINAQLLGSDLAVAHVQDAEIAEAAATLGRPPAGALPAQAAVRSRRGRDRDHRSLRQSRAASRAARRAGGSRAGAGGLRPRPSVSPHRGRRARVTSGEPRRPSSCPTACSRATAPRKWAMSSTASSPTARMTAGWCRWPACRPSTSPIFPERTGRSDRLPVIPTGAEPLDFARGGLREAQWRDLFCCLGNNTRSLDDAAP